MKVLYLTAIKQRKSRQDLIGKTHGWKAILNTLTIHYGDRITNHIQQQQTATLFTHKS